MLLLLLCVVLNCLDKPAVFIAILSTYCAIASMPLTLSLLAFTPSLHKLASSSNHAAFAGTHGTLYGSAGILAALVLLPRSPSWPDMLKLLLCLRPPLSPLTSTSSLGMIFLILVLVSTDSSITAARSCALLSAGTWLMPGLRTLLALKLA